MALTPIEIIALIFVLLALLKIIVIVINKKAWYNNVVKPVYSGGALTTVIFIVLAFIIFYYLLQELSIVQIFAVVALSSMLIGLGFLANSKELISVLQKAYNKKLSAWVWLYTLIWFILLLWVLYEIFLT
ncbi:MAG: hypothetical protein AABX55_02025 [Nanoarchaeota archaeon]